MRRISCVLKRWRMVRLYENDSELKIRVAFDKAARTRHHLR